MKGTASAEKFSPDAIKGCVGLGTATVGAALFAAALLFRLSMRTSARPAKAQPPNRMT